MTHGEKAQQIAQKYKNPRPMVGPCEFAAYEAALEAMEWKDQQFVAEKQALIDKACDAYCKICRHFSHTVPTHICRMDCHYYTDFKQLMEETK